MPLANGLWLEFLDRTLRYFGDYHRVRLVAFCDILLTEELFSHMEDPNAALREAERLLGKSYRFERTLERMGVPGADVDRVRQELRQGFLQTSSGYFARGDFPARMVRSALVKRRQANLLPFPGGD